MQKRRTLQIILSVAAVFAVAVGIAVICATASDVQYKKYQSSSAYISPSSVAISGNYAYVGDATKGKVYKSALTGGVVSEWDAHAPVQSVAVDGNVVYALAGEADGRIYRLTDGLSESGHAELGHTPTAAAVVGDKIYAANRFDGTVSVLNKNSLICSATIEVGREPIAMTVAGGYIYVAHHLPEGPADADVVSAKVTVIDTATDTVKKTITLLNGSGGVKDIVASENGDYIFVSHILARYAYPTSQLDRGWINTNALTVIDAGKQEVVTCVLLDEVDKGSPNPWGLAVSGDRLYVALSGSHELMRVDVSPVLERIQNVKNGKDKQLGGILEIPNYLPFLNGYRSRIALSGDGSRAVAVKDGKAYVCQYFTGNIEIVDLDSEESTGTLSLGTQAVADAVREGESLWFDGTKCYQSWESCASCHPDARTDALNWDNLNDGLGNPKQAASMMYSHRTPPVMITGARDTAEQAVRKGMEFIQFNTLGEEDLCKIDEYLKSLSPVQSPYLNSDGTLTESAQRGKVLFESQGCVTCHPAPLYTDLKKHKSAIIDTYDGWENRDFATPTLVEIWRTSPYFFNGQFKTLREAVTASLLPGHGLTESQIDDLTNFVGSIGSEGEIYGVEQVRGVTSAGVQKVNALEAGMTVESISVRAQYQSGARAKITFRLYDADGGELTDYKVTETLRVMDAGETAVISVKKTLPSDLAKGSYWIITVEDADTQTKLASDLKITY